MNASEYIVETIAKNGVKYIFGYIGGMITQLVDSIYKSQSVEMINAITEQGAGFAADGYARITNNLGVAIATSGPGATNLLTPMADCYFDSIPVLFITGQVNTNEYQRFEKIRQNGFQETNITDIARPILKYVSRVDDVANLEYELNRSIDIAQSGRKGPVLLDIHMNIQRSLLKVQNLKNTDTCDINKNDSCDFDNICACLKNAKSPLLLVGGGIRSSNSVDELREFLSKTKIPVVESLMGLDSVPSDYEYNLGLIGGYGNRYGNFALYNADLLLVIGTRLDLKQTGANLDFLKKTKVIQVDIDLNELNKDDIKKIKICKNARDFLITINKRISKLNVDEWRQQTLGWKDKYPTTKRINGRDNIPNLLVHKISELLRDDDVISIDVGQHQMWVAQALRIKKGQRLLFSGGLGSMGFALPCAIGASLTSKRCIVISGDGGFQMNIQELEIIKRRNLPIKIVIMNNKSLGMVRQFQESYFDSRFPSTVDDYSTPDFAQIASAYGIKAYKKEYKEIDDDFLYDFFENDSPSLLDVVFTEFTTVEPKLLFGDTLTNMSPKISSLKAEK